DSITDYFFTPTETANENLMRTGVNAAHVYYVGNIMIDSLYMNRNRLIEPGLVRQHNLDLAKCIVLTLHRPHNADNPERLKSVLETLVKNNSGYHIIFPIHPRTQKTLEETGFAHPQLLVTEPLSYLSFIYLVSHCRAVITDSGGIQEETTVMGVPCITLRNNTERPETVTIGTNELVGDDLGKLESALNSIFTGNWK